MARWGTSYDIEQERIFQFLTNNSKLVAATIAEIYKTRWSIELFLDRM